ncbi:sensor domain-containing diguanylate cyclase [Shewanella litoralis]|uniref:GGDEF domain-containing protein n=1 Tax=Shewanella litoralis TaxID=2282700 RepID=A0ABQ2R0B7_9GAMM|nr:sensor domain-containing diguanylate cyclase [Shewanella litoralis]GGQ03776.1 GGDEF domain-containing protein [Shewanella litoralis]
MDFDAQYGVVIHQDFIPRYADDTYAKIFGYENAQEILALKSILELIDPESQDIAAHTYYALMSGIEKPQVRSYINRNRLGEVMNVLAIEHLVEWQGRPALQITIVNLTQSLLLQQSLQQSEYRYRALLNGSVQGVLIHRQFTPLFCNQALATMLGYPNTQSIMALPSMLDFVDPAYRARREEALNNLFNHKINPSIVEIKCLHHSGKPVWVKLMETIIDWNGKPAIQATMTDITEAYLLKEKFEQQIHVDYLTKALNRRGMIAAGKALLLDEALQPQHLYCLLMGLDELKQINHLFGHDIGDKTLIHFARQCQSKLADADLLGRWSGDEFIAIVQASSKKIVRNIAESIRHSIDDIDFIDPETGKNLSFSASVGISKWQENDTLDELILRADSALEQARSQITNQLVMV